MTPRELSKSGSEHAHQCALFHWAWMAAKHGILAANDEACYEVKSYAETKYGNHRALHILELMHAIPNGGSRGDDAKSRSIRGAQMKAEGVKSGVPDIFLPCPRPITQIPFNLFGMTNPVNGVLICGLYIEMKKPTQKPKRSGAGGASDSQIIFINAIREYGYACVVCYSYLEAIEIITAYLGGQNVRASNTTY